jgi:hypothetical protein
MRISPNILLNYNLRIVSPVLAKEWHPTKNGKLTPRDVTPGSEKKVWWRCKKGHQWKTIVYNRTKGNGCPFCGNRAVCKDNCLRTVNPSLAREWHPMKNGKLTPRDVILGSSKRVWWRCKKGHEWQATIISRSKGIGCPYCAGSKVCKENCLKTNRPDLAKEWHPIKNEDLTPKDVTSGSSKKVWWRCKKGHEWQAVIAARTNGSGCIYCTGQAVCKDNCLKTINPILARQWHPIRNNGLTPKDVTPNSKKKVWWRCKKGHEWKAMVQDRNKGCSCPYCKGRIACNDNCLQTINPTLAREWHPTLNGDLTPRDVTPGSGKKAWWQCNRYHEWEARVYCRNRGTDCPYCWRMLQKGLKKQ